MADLVIYGLLASIASGVGVLGGLGGAVLLVPALVVLLGLAPAEAAPLGLMMVAAGSIAAGPRQLAERAVNHRLGVATELVASSGAVIGALASGIISEQVLTYSLAAVAALAAVAGGRRTGLRNPPHPDGAGSDVGERIGSLSGAYPLGDGIVPYRVRRLPLGMAAMGLAGLVAGVAGAGGGFIKTPATSEILTVPTKVAAATTTFTVGVTASTALLVMGLQGRIEPRSAAAVIAGSLLGGRLGAATQSLLHPARVRTALSGLLLVVAVVLVVRA